MRSWPDEKADMNRHSLARTPTGGLSSAMVDTATWVWTFVPECEKSAP
jgi:hypothetical protein